MRQSFFYFDMMEIKQFESCLKSFCHTTFVLEVEREDMKKDSQTPRTSTSNPHGVRVMMRLKIFYRCKLFYQTCQSLTQVE